MSLTRIGQLVVNRPLLEGSFNGAAVGRRLKTHYRSGALKNVPPRKPFGIVGVICAVVPGLFIGAAISKSVANFLEENDLFVPSDDDDDED
ncbi:unnamed protein product [Hermetia illucens]|uniref:Essential MCU regulator, mitochondrial n=1 Tax=Hermetia illucens TaxID=343691 RepID=A0A7R8YYK2_HERIL|nr:essential MCU regulator, mitochondrial [Hermetia illucens]CAD7089540.1 unnamed protein product [Hermetia illucens]